MHTAPLLLVVLSLCQQWLCPIRPLQPVPACPDLGGGAGRAAAIAERQGHLCSAPCPLQVYSRGELELIADLCVKHDVLCISDEVYEWLVYDGKEHIRIGTEDGLAELGWLLRVQHLQGRNWWFNCAFLEITRAACMHSSTGHVIVPG